MSVNLSALYKNDANSRSETSVQCVPSIVGVFRDLYSDPHQEFMKAANTLRENYRFAHTDIEELVNKYDSNGE